IRTADWFGHTTIVCSSDTVDVYNPKVIAATMGSFLRVHVVYLEIEPFMKRASELRIPILGAVLDGHSLYDASVPRGHMLVMGSESHGLRHRVSEYVSHPISIPKIGGAESLNVAIATGIIMSHTIKKSGE
ncbi:MAG: hypothetical protein RI911_953, partial [Candidatus Parcubacteria bacterium]